MTPRSKISARLCGACAGLAVAAGLVISGLLPAGHAGLGGARVSATADPTGELGVEPGGRFFSSASLRPGPADGGTRAVTTVTNQTATVLAVRVRALRSSATLDDLARVELSAGGRSLVRGRLGRLRRWSSRSLRLQPGEGEELELHAWLPSSVQRDYASRSVRLTLQFDTRFVGG